MQQLSSAHSLVLGTKLTIPSKLCHIIVARHPSMIDRHIKGELDNIDQNIFGKRTTIISYHRHILKKLNDLFLVHFSIFGTLIQYIFI